MWGTPKANRPTRPRRNPPAVHGFDNRYKGTWGNIWDVASEAWHRNGAALHKPDMVWWPLGPAQDPNAQVLNSLETTLLQNLQLWKLKSRDCQHRHLSGYLPGYLCGAIRCYHVILKKLRCQLKDIACDNFNRACSKGVRLGRIRWIFKSRRWQQNFASCRSSVLKVRNAGGCKGEWRIVTTSKLTESCKTARSTKDTKEGLAFIIHKMIRSLSQPGSFHKSVPRRRPGKTSKQNLTGWRAEWPNSGLIDFLGAHYPPSIELKREPVWVEGVVWRQSHWVPVVRHSLNSHWAKKRKASSPWCAASGLAPCCSNVSAICDGAVLDMLQVCNGSLLLWSKRIGLGWSVCIYGWMMHHMMWNSYIIMWCIIHPNVYIYIYTHGTDMMN